MNRINHLIISSRTDFSTDMICLEMEKRGLRYLRMNRDVLNASKMLLDLTEQKLSISTKYGDFLIEEKSLKSVYYRAPVFIRSNKIYSVEEQLYRSQWSAFLRNLITFENTKWVNNPVSTYRAENKGYQIRKALEVGLNVPKTYIGNYISKKMKEGTYAVKALDTPLFYDGDTESFTYTSILSMGELNHANLIDAPIIMQTGIEDKTDIRATIVGEKVFAAKILKNGHGIEGDWRMTKKEDLQYQQINLPDSILKSLRQLMKKLDLQFGGVDLVEKNGDYYFIEINPTGEWGWLVKIADFPIDKEIVNCLES